MTNMPKLNINFFLYFLVLLFFTNITHSREPIDFIKDVTSEASLILVNNISKDTKIKKLKELAEENVDIKGVGYYSLGKIRKTLSKSQLAEYENLFREYFLKSFSSRLSEYSDPKINVLSQDKVSEKYTIVSSVLVAKEDRPEVKIDWRVYTKNPEKPLIRDLIIEGLSLARTQKEEFGSIINSGDGNVEALFVNLKKFIQ
tara:strand:- start:27 stop:629 length:603 start_codon:yes stop_codon:yes gene_type:complete